jgi:hypothetical protein
MGLGDHRNDSRILGDIDPREPAVRNREPADVDDTGEQDEGMEGGSRHDRTEHSGSRDVTEGTTGGTGTETGGTRNYRTGTGATGGDIGNRPE